MSDGKGFLNQFTKPQQTIENAGIEANKAEEPKANEVESKPAETKQENTKEPVNEPEKSQAEEIKGNEVELKTTSEPAKEAKPAEEKKEVQKVEINDDAVLEYLKSKGKEVNSIDDLFKEPEPVQDPFEGLSQEVKDIIKFSKETNGRPLKDWLELNKDYSSMSPIELARAKAEKETKGKLSKEDLDLYLEKKLNIDLTDPDKLDKFDLIEIENYSEDYLNQKLSDKEKYKTPLEKRQDAEELVELDNGLKIHKGSLEELQNQRRTFVDAVKKSADSITDFNIKIKVDDNGSVQEYDIPYEYSKDDKHKMVSYSSDINETVNKLFGTSEGFNYKALNESVPWIDPEYREKKITAIVHKALAQRTEEIMAEEHNINFGKKTMPDSKDGKKIVPIPGTTNPYAVKFPI